MRYAFFGTPEFAALILERLIGAGFPPAALVCNPDRPMGRKKVMTPPPAKHSILEQDESIRETIEILQPEKVREVEEVLNHGKFDYFIVAAYGNIIPQRILAIPPFGTIGVHPSLLPRHRGASPIQTALLQGDRETGVTLFAIDEKVDHGAVIAQEALDGYDLETLTYTDLHNALAGLGGQMLVRLIPKIGVEKLPLEVQDESKATLTVKFEGKDGFVDAMDLDTAMTGHDLEQAVSIDRKIRALNPEPGVYTIRNETRVKLLEATIHEGTLILKKIQEEGKLPKNL